VAMASRLFHLYDVRKMDLPAQERESSLKYMTRSLGVMSGGEGELLFLLWIAVDNSRILHSSFFHLSRILAPSCFILLCTLRFSLNSYIVRLRRWLSGRSHRC
jgi:hypothetical protein